MDQTISFQEFFYLTKTSFLLTELWIMFKLVWYIVKKRPISAQTTVDSQDDQNCHLMDFMWKNKESDLFLSGICKVWISSTS